MIDVHCHLSAGDPSIREWLIGREFVGIHPWDAALASPEPISGTIGIGEIGLDRLRSKTISLRMRDIFLTQLKWAAARHVPVVLHGAKCWGEVVATVRPFVSAIPAFLFHGFSRSDGLVPEILALPGFISVGPAILNDHAVNYRALVKKIPVDRLLVETDRTNPGGVSIREVANGLAAVLGLSLAELEAITDENAARFLSLSQPRN